jgi:peroxiredoxin
MLEHGDAAPDFRLKGTDNVTHSISEQKGAKATAVIFSCNHCPYVRAYEDRMILLAKAFQPKGVKFVLINANDTVKHPNDSFEGMVTRAKEKAYPFAYLHDETQKVARAYGAERTPEVFLFDEGLKLRYHGTIDDNYEKPEAVKIQYLKLALESVVGGKEVPQKETAPVGCTIKWK